MSGKKLVLLLTAALFAATLWGCGSSRDSGGDEIISQEGNSGSVNAQTVGMDVCTNCHGGQTDRWLDSRHANINGSPSSVHAPDTFCGSCHNDNGDSDVVTIVDGGFYRDVIGCESCHGGGSMHYGMGPLPVAKPGLAECATCHAGTDSEGNYTAMYARGGHDDTAVTAVVDYLNSPHATGKVRDKSSRSDTIGCVRCHSHEGPRVYGNKSDVDAITAKAYPLGDENISSISCTTCHDPHGGMLVNGSETASAEFNTCTHCHAKDGDLDYHAGHMDELGLDRNILDTHFDDPTTVEIEGYNINKLAENACAACHNVHSADVTIQRQWAQSGHAGTIGKVKAAAAAVEGATDADIIAAAAGEADAPGFVHYNFSTRASCAMCHTATGAANFLSDPENYDSADNDFSHLADEQREVLTCNACHDNAGSGSLRNPGVITAQDGTAYPDVANSNTCLTCHSGRSGGDDVDTLTDYTNAKFVNSHYLPAAGVLYATGGYEYDIDGDPTTEDYPRKGYYQHDGLGTKAFGGLVTEDIVDHGEVVGQQVVGAGPCVSCHMSDESGHTFEPILTDAEGTVTLPAVCSSCHNTTDPAGSHYFSAEILLDEQHEYHETVDMLGDALAAAGHPYLGSYPYFAQSDWTNGGTRDGAMTLGAAFNYGMLHHEPGAYAHNRYYTKRLLFDSLDALDGDVFLAPVTDADGNVTVAEGQDGDVLDGYIKIDTVTYPGAAIWLGADENGVAKRP